VRKASGRAITGRKRPPGIKITGTERPEKKDPGIREQRPPELSVYYRGRDTARLRDQIEKGE
jgi:hypothetical protein